MKKNLILIPGTDLPFFKYNNLSDIDIILTLQEAEKIMKDLGAGTYVWGEPDNYKCPQTVLDFLGRNMMLALEVRLRVLGLY